MAAYPSVPAPYGLKPINLIGGQVFAGSTRMYPIQYGYATNIGYGDFVKVTTYSSGATPGGLLERVSIGATTSSNAFTGVFLGCTYTNPTTKQKTFSQYWPASTLAGDAMAYVTDDPDTVFKAVVCSSGTTVASGAVGMLGQNLSMINNSASTTTGDSANAVLAPTATPVTTILPVRVVGLVYETAITYSATATSASSSTTVNAVAPAALPVGTNVSYLAANGQVIETGMFLTSAATAGATTQTLNQQPVILGSNANIPSGSTIIYTVYPEILVKLNVLSHGYYSSVTA
jgi:hypothetical protein